MNSSRHSTGPRRSFAAATEDDVKVRDEALARRLLLVEEEAKRLVSGIHEAAVVPIVSAFDALVADWEANVRAQLDRIAFVCANNASVATRRTEVQRAHRDLSRWLRVLSERAEAQMRSDTPASAWTTTVSRFAATCGGLATMSAPTDVDIFLPETGDSTLRRARKVLAARRARRTEEQRGVPLRALAGRYLLAPVLESLPGWQNRFGAARILAWRSLRRAASALSDVLRRADAAVADEQSVDWGRVADEIAEAFDLVRSDLDRAVADVVSRANNDVAGALLDLRYAALRSDTFLLPARLYEAGTSSAQIEAAIARVRAGSEAWARVATGSCGALAVALDADAFLSAVRFAHLRDGAEIDRILSQRFVTPIATFSERFARARALLDTELESGATDTLAASVRDVRETLHAMVEHLLLEVLRDPATLRALQERVAELRRSTSRAVQRLGTEFRVVVEREARLIEGDDAPSSPLHPVHPRAIADAVLTTAVEGSVETVWRMLQGMLDATVERAGELQRAIDWHLETAARELASAGNSPDVGREYVRAGLERIGEIAAGLDAGTRDARVAVVETAMASAPEALAEFQSRIRDLQSTRVEGGKTSQLPSVAAGGSVREQVRSDLLARFRERTDARRATQQLAVVSTRSELVEAMRTASFDSVAEGPIPDGYVRLFRGRDQTTASIKFGLHDVVNDVRAALTAWESGDPEAVAVTGHSGIGKGDLLDRVAEDVVGGYDTFRFVLRRRVTDVTPLARELAAALHLDGASSLGELQRSLESRETRAVILMEGGEFLFLRDARGLDAARAFLSLVTATSDRVFWVVTFERLAFEFLTSVLHLADAFTYVLDIDLLDRDEVEQLILSRHRTSGLGLSFRREIELDGDESTRQRRFFGDLHAASGGHPVLASYYWLRSVQELDASGRIVVGPLRPLPTDLLAPLDGVRRAALGTLMLHGGLDRDSFAQAMRLAPDESASLLAQLRHMHLVECNELGIHDINPVALIAIYRELRSLNVF